MVRMLAAVIFRILGVLTLFVAITAAAIAVPASNVRAAGLDYCVRYATQAVSQFNRNRAIPGCFKGADQVTWHGDYDRHYAWCVAQTEEKAREAIAYRDGRLRGCSMRAYGHE
jgi:hypothetical protein